MSLSEGQKPHALVIGGGLGGLAGAILLAHKGFTVTLFEQNETLGGKMNTRILSSTHGEFAFGTGPSLLTMPFVIDRLFAEVGIDRTTRLTFEPLEPLCRYFFSDHSQFDASSDMARMQSRIHSFAQPEEATAYSTFLDYAETIYRTTADVFLYTPFQEWKKIFHPRYAPALFGLHRIDAFRTVNDSIRSFFRDERLIQLFNRYPTYNGSTPFKAPATLNIIPYVEYGLGGYYIKGGMYRLVEELVRLAQELGVIIHTQSQVQSILRHHGKVSGVRVQSIQDQAITTHHADYVLCNADVVEAHRTLLTDFPQRTRRLTVLEPSISGMVFLWGINRSFPMLSHHNIFFSEHYQQEFHQIFDELRTPDDPTVYISIASKSDPHLAPNGCENWFVLLNMPYMNGQDWSAEIPRMKQKILQKLKAHGIDVEEHIVCEETMSPETLYNLYGSNKGSIYGISSNTQWSAFLRPANRSRDVEGLYFCGGSSHPGGGVPLVLLSGMMSAQLIAEDAGEPQRRSIMDK